MAEVIPVGIAGLGIYTPEKVMTNHDLESIVDTSDEWIQQRTGIKERRIAREDEWASTMGAKAAEQALSDAGVDAADVDLIITCTVTGDQPFPATACTLGALIGAEKAGGWDLGAACSGFLFGLQAAAQFVGTGQFHNVLVVGVEKLSSILDYTDRNTCVLFGDGAGAALVTSLERAGGRGEMLSHSVGMTGHSEDVLSVPGGGSRIPTTHDSVEQRLHYMKMGGSKVYRFAVKIFAELVEKALAPYDRSELGLVVPHQVNARILENAAERVGVSMDKVFVNIDKYGNTSAASVPIALYEAREQGLLEEGKLVCMVAFGAGMAWAHTLLRW